MIDPKFIVGIDMDGVLANFTDAYIDILREVSGKSGTLDHGHEPDCWNWPTKYGFSHEDDNAAWKAIKASKDFWIHLKPYLETLPTIAMTNLLYANGHLTYFITNRPGQHTHGQSLFWLQRAGMPVAQVIVAEEKGPVAVALKLTHFIDDKPSNCYDVRQASPSTDVFMLVKPYNTTPADVMKCESLGIHRITTIKAMFDAMGREENAHALVV